MDLLRMFQEDVEGSAPSEVELTDLAVLAEKQIFLEGRVKEVEELLDTVKEQLRVIQEQHIPEAMSTIGMKEFKLLNGYKITIKDDVFASIRKDFINQAVAWLDTKGLGDIVKDDVTVKFGRGEGEKATALLEYCNGRGFNANEKLSVHPQTLKATVKEQLEKGVEFPEEFFSIGPVRKAIIKVK